MYFNDKVPRCGGVLGFLTFSGTCEVFKTLNNSDGGCLTFALVLMHLEMMCWHY